MPHHRNHSRRRLSLQSVLAVAMAGVASVAHSPQPAVGVTERPNAVIIGDSITAFHMPVIAAEFEGRGIPGIMIDAQPARQIERSVTHEGEYIRSGILSITQLKIRLIDPRLWIIELGTNDIPAAIGSDRHEQVAAADDLIVQVLDVLGPEARIAWVTVSYRTFPGESDAFNEALRRRATVDSRLTLVDWHALSVTHHDWFADAVHPNEGGASELSELYVRTVLNLLYSPPKPPGLYPYARRLGMS
jgi:lysophospholipase L1-like esterase